MKIKGINPSITFFMVFILSSCSADMNKPGPEVPVFSFSTGGSPAYQISPATVEKNGKRVIISAGYDGTVQCHRPDGKLVWKTQTGGYFPNDLDVSDLNGDGRDETLVASADGLLYAFDHKGKLMWKFTREAPLLSVSVVNSGTSKLILTGGVERVIYALDTGGNVKAEYISDHLVKRIRKGNILGTGKDYIAVLYARRNRGIGQYFLQLFDPVNLKPAWEKDLNIAVDNPHECYFDLLTADIDRDGHDDIVLSHGWRDLGKLSAYNATGEKIHLPVYKAQGITQPTYRMNRIVGVQSPDMKEGYLLGLFGNQMIQYNPDLTMRNIYTTTLSYSNGAYDPETKTLLIGGSICGDDCIHVLDLENDKWPEAYQNLKPEGRLAQVIQNMENLNHAIDQFSPPAYQPKPAPVNITGRRPQGPAHDSLQNITFTGRLGFNENYDRSTLPGIYKTKKEIRFSYDDTQEEIFKRVEAMEKKGESFTVTAGHGIDPFYMQMSTLKGILARAPNNFVAFVFAEMESTDQTMVDALNERIVPLAELCKQYGKKIIFENKNIFWFGNCYLDLWKNVLLNPRYSEVFIPSMEESNNRCQDLSISGRAGLWLTGNFDRYSSRAITDNACYNRIWEWSSQQVLSHLIRSMVLGASLGSDILLISTHQGDPNQMMTLYKLIDKGIIMVPKTDDLLSVSDVCLGMMTPSDGFLKHGTNGHDLCGYNQEEKKYVFDRLDCFWGGAPIQPHDFSYYGTGSKRRMLDFLPKNPYGLVAFVPDDIDLSKHPRFTRKISTDGEFFYDDQGIKHTAEEYRPIVEKHLQEASTRMPVLVEGDVSWTVVRIDDNHFRIVIIDAGYLDPSDRLAIVKFQNIKATECRDILSNETIPVSDNSVKITVPAGIFRVIDITY